MEVPTLSVSGFWLGETVFAKNGRPTRARVTPKTGDMGARTASRWVYGCPYRRVAFSDRDFGYGVRNGVVTDRGQEFPAATPNGEMHLNGGVPRKIVLRVFVTIMLGESSPVKCVISGLWAEILSKSDFRRGRSKTANQGGFLFNFSRIKKAKVHKQLLYGRFLSEVPPFRVQFTSKIFRGTQEISPTTTFQTESIRFALK